MSPHTPRPLSEYAVTFPAMFATTPHPTLGVVPGLSRRWVRIVATDRNTAQQVAWLLFGHHHAHVYPLDDFLSSDVRKQYPLGEFRLADRHRHQGVNNAPHEELRHSAAERRQ